VLQFVPVQPVLQDEQVPSPLRPSLHVPCWQVHAPQLAPKYPDAHVSQLSPVQPVAHEPVAHFPSPATPSLHVPFTHVHARQLDP
jgi:hypothetical protein